MKIWLVCPNCGMDDWSYPGGDLFKCDCCGAEVATEGMIGETMDFFAPAWWSDDDIVEAMESMGLDVTDENVGKWRNILDSEAYQERITETMIAAGWDAIYGIMREVLREQNGGISNE